MDCEIQFLSRYAVRLSASHQLTKGVILLVVWFLMAGLTWVDTIDLTDDMEVNASPVKVLQQAVESDLDDIRQITGTILSSVQFPWILGPDLPTEGRPISSWAALPLHSPQLALFQRFSTYRI